jgi:hypothetical protein
MTAPPDALSVISMVQVFELPVAGTVGVKVMVRVSGFPRLSKYWTVITSASPAAPAAVDVAGTFKPIVTAVVGEP